MTSQRNWMTRDYERTVVQLWLNSDSVLFEGFNMTLLLWCIQRHTFYMQPKDFEFYFPVGHTNPSQSCPCDLNMHVVELMQAS